MARLTNRARRASELATARQRAAAIRSAHAAKRRKKRRIVVASATVVLVVVAGSIALVVANRGSTTSRDATTTRRAVALAAQAGTARPPWPRPEDTLARASQAGLSVDPAEGTAVHFHVHLDVFVNGQREAVPEGLGQGPGGLAELHTHDSTGVVHVEAPKAGQWVLGQVFDEWNVRLTARQIGGLVAAGSPLAVYVDGKRMAGNPAAISLKPHQEIALVYGGVKIHQVPDSYTFPPGE